MTVIGGGIPARYLEHRLTDIWVSCVRKEGTADAGSRRGARKDSTYAPGY